MTATTPDPDDLRLQQEESVDSPDDFGGLSIEDDPDGTVNPADLAGTAGDDDSAGYAPDHTEADADLED